MQLGMMKYADFTLVHALVTAFWLPCDDFTLVNALVTVFWLPCDVLRFYCPFSVNGKWCWLFFNCFGKSIKVYNLEDQLLRKMPKGSWSFGN